MIDYLLVLIITFAGVLTGGVLALLSPEELKQGEKYWKILKWALLILIIAVLFYFSGNIFFAAAIAALLVILKILKREYPALAFVLFLSSKESFLLIAASLIFIYGLPSGTLDAKPIVGKKARGKIKKTIAGIIRKNFYYLIIGGALPVISFFI